MNPQRAGETDGSSPLFRLESSELTTGHLATSKEWRTHGAGICQDYTCSRNVVSPDCNVKCASSIAPAELVSVERVCEPQG
jgi:hypothetical protein